MPTTSPLRTLRSLPYDHLPVGMAGVIDAPVLHLENRLADLGRALRIAVGQFAADHVLDDAVFADLLLVAVQRVDRGAIAQDGDQNPRPSEISLSLCEMRIEEMPWRAEFLQQRQQHRCRFH